MGPTPALPQSLRSTGSASSAGSSPYQFDDGGVPAIIGVGLGFFEKESGGLFAVEAGGVLAERGRDRAGRTRGFSAGRR